MPKKNEELSDSARVFADTERIHGKNIIRKGAEAGKWQHIPTNIFTLDMAQHGGLPRSCISMYYGWESAGKTLCAMRAIANAQKMFPDMKAVMIDAEGTYDPPWGAVHGIDNDNLIYVQPEYGEQALDITNQLIRSKDVSIIVVDSIPALVPLKQQAKSLEDDVVAMQARLINRFIALANQSIIDTRREGHRPAVLMVNQWRSRIAFMGDNRTLPGGNAIKYFLFNRIEILSKEEKGKDQYGNELVTHNIHSFKVTKNKEGNGIKSGEFKLIRDPSHPLGVGAIDEADTIITYAKRFGLWTGAGKSQNLDGVDQTFPTMAAGADYLNANPEFTEQLKLRLISIQRDNNGLPPDGWY